MLKPSSSLTAKPGTPSVSGRSKIKRRWPSVLLATLGGFFGIAGVAIIVKPGWFCLNRGPILVVENPIRHLAPSNGNLMTPEVIFRMKNAGNEALRIERILTSCGCTLVRVPKQPLKPGEESAIVVTAVRPAVGNPSTVTVTVKSNSRIDPVKKLQITGFAEKTAPFVFSNSERIFLANVLQPGVAQEFWIRTIEGDDESPLITTLGSTLSFLELSLMCEKAKPFRQGYVERTYSFTAIIASLPDVGNHQGFITIPEIPDFRMPILVQVGQLIQILPSALFASVFLGESPPEFRVRIRHADSHFLRSLNVTSSPADQISTDMTAGDDSKEVLCAVRAAGPASEAVWRGEISVESREIAGKVVVPVVVYATESN